MTNFNTLRLRQNGCHFPDDIFKCIFLNENVWISIKVSLKFVPKGPINKIPSLVQIMAWCRSGDKPLSEPMMVSLLMHICVTRPQWVKPMSYQTLSQWNKMSWKSPLIGCNFGQSQKLEPGLGHETYTFWKGQHSTEWFPGDWQPQDIKKLMTAYSENNNVVSGCMSTLKQKGRSSRHLVLTGYTLMG